MGLLPKSNTNTAYHYRRVVVGLVELVDDVIVVFLELVIRATNHVPPNASSFIEEVII